MSDSKTPLGIFLLFVSWIAFSLNSHKCLKALGKWCMLCLKKHRYQQILLTIHQKNYYFYIGGRGDEKTAATKGKAFSRGCRKLNRTDRRFSDGQIRNRHTSFPVQLMQAQLNELTDQLVELIKQMTEYEYLGSVPALFSPSNL